MLRLIGLAFGVAAYGQHQGGQPRGQLRRGQHQGQPQGQPQGQFQGQPQGQFQGQPQGQPHGGSTYSQAEDDNAVTQLTDELFQAMNSPNPVESMPELYHENATITCGEKGGLPGSGTYTTETLPLMLTRWDLAWEGDEDISYTIEATDVAKGTALVSAEQQGKFLRTGQSATLSSFHVLEFDQVNNKVLKHLILDKDMKSTAAAYQTLAEKKLWAMLWAFYRADFDSIVDLSAPSWQMVSEDVKAKNNMFPQLLSKNEWSGKKELAKGFAEWFEMLQEAGGPLNEMYSNKQLMAKVMKQKHFTILSASDTEVFANFGDGIIVHYTFEEGPSGLLIGEECLFSKAVQPWDIYPFPVPMKKEDLTDEPQRTDRDASAFGRD